MEEVAIEPFNMHTLRVRYVPNMVGYVPSDRGLGTVQTGAVQSVTLPPEEDIAMRKLSLHKSAGETVRSSEEEHVVTAVSVTALVLPVRRTVKDVTLDWAAWKGRQTCKGVARQIRVHVRAPFGRQTQLVVGRGNITSTSTALSIKRTSGTSVVLPHAADTTDAPATVSTL